VSPPEDRPEAPRRRVQPPLGEPGPSIPRWLALLVLIALLGSAAWSTWLILAPKSEDVAPSAGARSEEG